MQLTVSVKQLGRKQPILSNKIIEIDDVGMSPSIQQLIVAVVDQQVAAFNAKPTDNFKEQSLAGKIGFGSIYNEAKADPVAARKIALQAFEDGLFVIFADDREYTKLSDIISLQPDTVISFIRLVFLAGSFW